MDFDFSADQEALRASVRAYLTAKAPLSYVRAHYGNPDSRADEVWRGLADLGMTALLVPESAGGLGLGMVDIGPALEESGRAVYPGPLVSSAVVATSALTLAGDNDELLGELTRGAWVGTLAVLEPNARYDWRAPTTVVDGGRLSGTKVHVADAPSADAFVVSATDGLYVVEEDGFTVEPTEAFDGSRSTGSVRFDAAPARRIGDLDLLAEVLDRAAVATVVEGVGAAEQALAMAVEYAKSREQFGRPIGSFQAVQHLCADMLQLLELGRAGAYYALWALDDAPREEAHRAATMAKAWASDAFPKVGATAIQVFGGIGFTWEHDIHLFYKRLLSVEQSYGAAAEHYEELATLVL